jgi:hypothetical protein
MLRRGAVGPSGGGFVVSPARAAVLPGIRPFIISRLRQRPPCKQAMIIAAARIAATWALPGLLATVAAGAWAEEAGHPCAFVPDPAGRLACYDNAFGRPPASRPESQEPPAARLDPEAESERLVEEFGLTPALQRAQDAADGQDQALDRIEAVAVRVSRRAGGAQVIALDNGQVWLQTEPDNRGRLSEGDRVVIRKAALGSFLLVTEARGSMRVRRIE